MFRDTLDAGVVYTVSRYVLVKDWLLGGAEAWIHGIEMLLAYPVEHTGLVDGADGVVNATILETYVLKNGGYRERVAIVELPARYMTLNDIYLGYSIRITPYNP